MIATVNRVGKMELIDSEENNYVVVSYMSEAIQGISIFLKILFKSDSREVTADYGYDESHGTKKADFYSAYEFEIVEVSEDGDEVSLKSEDIIKLHNEASANFKKYFDGGDYDDLSYGLSKGKYKDGGKVGFLNPQKFIKYNGQFLYPPRIEHKLQPASLDKFDDNQYIGQPKLNGSNTSVTISEDGAVAKERHNKFFYAPPKFDFKLLHRGNGFMCIAGEFMNKSKKDETNKPFKGFCIWDIIAFNGEILIGSTIEERIKLLDKLYPSKGSVSTNGIKYLYKTEVQDIYKVANFYSDFSKIYKELSKVDMVEGYVLKRKSGKLEMMSREQNNTGCAVKVRKPTANYQF